jgi:glycosyltransferase involved in cell wall biosynthesis
VIFPPVDAGSFEISSHVDDYYLVVGQLVRYKRPDLAVETFSRVGKPLIVIGEGELLPSLKKMAGPNVQFLGRQPFEVIRAHYSRCKAFVFPGEEDFGMTPVEAQASGRPVIAYGKGGALETVVDGKTGIFFHDQTVDALQTAIQDFESREESFDPSVIREHSLKFDRTRFLEEMKQFIEEKVAEHFAAFRA